MQAGTGAAVAAAQIQLLVLDVDGVLTDGRLYFGPQGEALKAFSVLDGQGIRMLQAAGIEVAAVSGRDSAITTRRLAELEVSTVIQGRTDKLEVLQDLAQARGLALSQVAYAGDDLPDLAAVAAAGLGVAVANAVAEVRSAADAITNAAGGAGAVRELGDFILASRKSG